MADFTKWEPELEAALRERFPLEQHSTKTLGGKDITYVPWYYYVERLDRLVGSDGWQSSIQIHDAGGRLIILCSVTILGVTKSNVGDESERTESYGSPAVNAYAQALKRTLALFGMGFYMYLPQDKPPPKQKRGKPKGDSDDPIMTSGPHQGKKLSQVDDVEWLQSWWLRANSAWRRRIAIRLDQLGAEVPIDNG